MLGILLIDKPKGCTSHDVVDQLRRTFGTKRVGHAGTLDPLATGLLVVAVGPATRFLQYLPLEPKVYAAEVTFGHRTDSYDAEGEMLAGGPVPDDLAEQLAAQGENFTGLIEQMPPMFSAVKVDGKALYKYARKGESVERKSRTVHIESIVVEAVEGNNARIRVMCSGGTYIRTLANDLGDAIGCGAFLSALRRTRVGAFDLAQAVPLSIASAERLIPLADALKPMVVAKLSSEDVGAVREGRAIPLEGFPDGKVALADSIGEVFSIAALVGNVAQPECVIPSEARH